jgi:hypothetical protein
MSWIVSNAVDQTQGTSIVITLLISVMTCFAEF